MSLEWNLHYSRWVIDDGSTSELEVGDQFDCLQVECWSDNTLIPSNRGQDISAEPIADYKYRVKAKVIHVSEDASVIDIGIAALGTRALLPQECKDGDFVTGEIGIGCFLPRWTEHVPDDVLFKVKRTWRVNRISADLTVCSPRPEDSHGLERYNSRVQYEEVAATYSVKVSSYILHCTQL
jgi:hypothetical protein